MTAPPHPIPEYWTELIAARRQRHQCAEQVDAIKSSCQSRCGKKHISECPACHGKALDRLRRRYVDSPEREWFTQRKAFLQELDGLFADARNHGRSIKAIEARIESEKEAWYRWVLRRHPEFLAVRDGGVRQDELRAMLDDPDCTRDKMVGMMWQGIGEPSDWAERLDRLAANLGTITTTNTTGDEQQQQRKRLYAREFFLDTATGEPLRNAAPYLGEYEASSDTRLEDVIGRIAHGTQESRRTQPQRETHRLRLADLRRAKTAFELNKAQAKGLAKAVEVLPGEDLYELPSCLVCGAAANANDVFSCSVCQALTQSGGRKKLTIYCSKDCYDVGHESHVESEHDCEAASRCTQLFDEDVVMENSALSTGTFACRACFAEKKAAAALFCSERCALENIADHRRRVHGAGVTNAGEIAGLIGPLAEVVGGILRRENPGLEVRLERG